MKMLKRVITRIKRKPAQSILMFMIVFVLGNVLFASIAIKQSSNNVRMELRSRMPTSLKLLNIQTKIPESKSEDMNALIEELKQDENVLSIAYQTNASVRSIEVYQEATYLSSLDFIALQNIQDKESLLCDYTISKGRFFTKEDLESDVPKIVLNRYLDYQYDIGDIYTINLSDYEIQFPERGGTIKIGPKTHDLPTYDFEIIGFYDATIKPEYQAEDLNISLFSPIVSMKSIQEISAIQNEIYAAHSQQDQSFIKSSYYEQYRQKVSTTIPCALITTKGIDASEILEKNIRDHSLFPSSYYSLTSSASDYLYIQAPLENLVALANVALSASVVLVIVLLSLISILFIRNRKQEIGIYMAMGERKSKILGQFICEILLVGLLACGCSMMSGNYLGEKISNEFIKIQIDTDSEMKYHEKNPNAMTQLDLIEAYKVELNTQYMLMIFIASTAILLISSAMPLLYIVRIKPKNILM